MKIRASIFILLLAFGGSLTLAQSTYMGLTPGKSSRQEAERVFGQPQKKLSPTLVEYKIPKGAGRVYVQYSADSASATVARVEFTCANEQCEGIHHELRGLVTGVVFDARVYEPGTAEERLAATSRKATIYFGAPLFLRYVDISKGNDFENRMALMSSELYQAAVPSGGCSGSIFGKWRTQKSISDRDLGLLTIERGENGSIRGTFDKQGTLSIGPDEKWRNFLHGINNYKGEWKDETGAGTIELEISLQTGRRIEAKLIQTSSTSKAPVAPKPRPSVFDAIRADRPNWYGDCGP